jgi:hypothetical protein
MLRLALLLAVPGLATAQESKNITPQALAAFTAKAKAQGLTADDLSSPLVTDSYTDASGLTHTYLQQRVNGLAVFNATGAVHTNAAGKVVFVTQAFVPAAAATAPAPTPALTPEQAVTAATVALGLPRPVGLRRLVEARPADGLVFNNAGIAADNIMVRLLYDRVGDRNGEKLVLTWSVSIVTLDQQHAWMTRVDAQTGHLVSKNDLVVSELTTFRQHTTTALGRQQQALAYETSRLSTPAQVAGPLGTTAANSLTVVAMPGENPTVAPRTIVPLSAANPLYSPYGWQVGQGLAPSGFFDNTYSLLSSGRQLTRGNNVAAYDDSSNPNANILLSPSLTNPTTSPSGGASLDFDFTYDPTKSTRDAGNLAAGITNLFYWNNVNHDVMMAHGFDEAAGNFQYKNLTGAGLGNDFVLAESQDGSGRNNANFYTPADGTNGRMQMYVFDNTQQNNLTVTGGGGAAGVYKFASVAFGPSVTQKPLASQLVLVNDGVSADNGNHACATPFVNAAAVNGNVAFIQRGGCAQLTTLNPRATSTLDNKVRRAQTNGATAVIVFDSVATGTGLFNFSGVDTVGLRIPAIFISGVDGFKLRAAIQAGNTLTVNATKGADFDGSFDSGVMSHEFGHGISNRLTGGPATATCLNNSPGSQTMGEGWSDFFGLWMTTRPGDIGSTPRYVGAYDTGQNIATGPGFRHQPYTTNMSLNTYTYAKLGLGSGQYYETHDVGEVWCTVLWDLNWQYIYKYGYSTDFYATTGGNNRMLQLVLDGCKLQVCQPGFLDGRDALLRADSLSTRGANSSLIWAVFARRGMGYSAKQGDRTSGVPLVTGIVPAFDVPPTAQVITLSTANGAVSASALEAFPNPAQNRLTVRSQLSGTAPVRVEVLNLLGQVVVAGQVASPSQLQQGLDIDTSPLAAGLYVVRVAAASGTYTIKVTIQR